MTKIISSMLILMSSLCLSLPLMASTDTRAEIGYMGFESHTLERNPGAFDQPYLLLSHQQPLANQSLFTSVKLENPGRLVQDQQHHSGRQAAKLFGRYQPQATGQRGLWLQGFSMLSENIVENNLFMGLKQGNRIGTVDMKFGAGAHYSFGRSEFSKQDYATWSGMVTTVQLNWRYAKSNLSLDWIGHYFRDDKHMDTFGYHGHGQQLTLAANQPLSENWQFQSKLTGYKSLGANPNDGLEYAVGINYRF